MLQDSASPLIAFVRRLLGRNASRSPACPAPAAAELTPNLLAPQPAAATPRAIGPAGIALIKRFEGCARLRPDGLIEA